MTIALRPGGAGDVSTMPPSSAHARLSAKVLHVKLQGQTRQHHCHWPGCDADVPPAKWGCSKHWFTLPKPLRDRVWAAYVPGQEVTATASAQYVVVAREVQDWIAQQELNSPPEAGDQRAAPLEQWAGLTKGSSAEAIDRLIFEIEFP
jgi:hypothetical protein